MRRHLSSRDFLLVVILSAMATSALIGDEIKGFMDGLVIGFTDEV